jgi:uncharacterized protein (UPF0276 family)
VSFSSRIQSLPVLGLGISTEYGAPDAPGALDPLELRAADPRFGRFLEVGLEIAKGLDSHALAWAAQGLPSTYHFLDINLDEPEDFDAAWLQQVRTAVETLKPAWLCGDAGLWHLGPRERGHMLLLPPILVAEAVKPMAEGIIRLREETGLEVLPENPPGHAFVGDLHILDFFGRLLEAADTGIVLDCAHLAIYQHMMGHRPTTGLDDFPLDRVVELHIAGGTEQHLHGMPWIEDDHGTTILPETWEIVDHMVAHAPNLRAIIIECERNPLAEVLPLFEAVAERFSGHSLGEPA